MPDTNPPSRGEAPGEFKASPRTSPAATAVLELRVRNHPGTMSHITGLFARRAFNLEAIACAPNRDRATSCILLLVSDEPRLAQLERQLEKLHDVLAVRHRSDLNAGIFRRMVDAVPS